MFFCQKPDAKGAYDDPFLIPPDGKPHRMAPTESGLEQSAVRFGQVMGSGVWQSGKNQINGLGTMVLVGLVSRRRGKLERQLLLALQVAPEGGSAKKESVSLIEYHLLDKLEKSLTNLLRAGKAESKQRPGKKDIKIASIRVGDLTITLIKRAGDAGVFFEIQSKTYRVTCSAELARLPAMIDQLARIRRYLASAR